MIDPHQRRRYSTEYIINSLGCGCFQVYVFVMSSFVFICEASELMLLSLLMPTLQSHWGLSEFEEGLIGAVVFTGFFLSHPLVGFFSDNCGRKPTLIAGVLVMMIMGAISSLCDQYVLFLIVRFFVGLSVGVSHVGISLLIEFLPVKGRGIVGSLAVGAWGYGSFFVAVLAWIVIPNYGTNAWQYYVFLASSPLFMIFWFLCCLPESMRYLSFSHNASNREKNQRRMKRTIRQIEKMNCKSLEEIIDEDEEERRRRRREIVDSDEEEEEEEEDDTEKSFDIEIIPPYEYERSFISELRRHPRLLFMLLNIMIFSSFTGFPYYALSLMTPDIFNSDPDEDGVDNAMYYGTMISSSAEVIAIPFFICTIPLFGRKTINVIYLFLAMIGFICLSLPVEDRIYLVIFSLVTRFFIFSAGTLQFILVQESLPTNIRSRGFGVVFMVSRFCVIFSPLFAKAFYDPELEDPGTGLHIGMGILALFCFIALASMIVHPMETKGRGILDVFGRLDKTDFCSNIFCCRRVLQRRRKELREKNILRRTRDQHLVHEDDDEYEEEEEDNENNDMDLPLLKHDHNIHDVDEK